MATKSGDMGIMPNTPGAGSMRMAARLSLAPRKMRSAVVTSSTASARKRKVGMMSSAQTRSNMPMGTMAR